MPTPVVIGSGSEIWSTTNTKLVSVTIPEDRPTLVYLTVHQEHNSTAAAPISSIVDNSGLVTWNERLPRQDFADPGRGGDTQRKQVFWAIISKAGTYSFNINQDKNVDDATAGYILVRNINTSAPFDADVSLPAQEDHDESATSSVTGVSTDGTGLIVHTYGLGRNEDIGIMTDFTEHVDRVNTGGSNWSRTFVQTKTLATPDSGATYTVPNATIIGAMMIDVVADGPDVDPDRRVLFIEGYDHYVDGTWEPGTLSALGAQEIGTLGPDPTFVTGRDGVGQAIRLGAGDAATQLFYTSSGALLMAADLEEGIPYAIGFNVNMGSNTVHGSATGWHSVLRLMTSTAASGLTVGFNITTKEWGVFAGEVDDTLLISGSLDDTLDDGAPTQDPYQTWVFVEIEFFFDSLDGYVRIWQEYSGTAWQIPPYTRGVLPPNETSVSLLELGLACAFEGDTSKATRGDMDDFAIGASRLSSTNFVGHDYDDLYLAKWGKTGRPCYVKTVAPTSDFSVTGVTPSAGGDVFAVMDDGPVDTADYASSSTADDFALMGFPLLSATPVEIFAVQGVVAASMPSGSGSARCASRVNGVNQLGASVGMSTALRSLGICWPYNPETNLSWAFDETNDIPSGPYISSASAEVRFYDAWQFLLVSIEEGDLAIVGQPAEAIPMQNLVAGVDALWQSLHSIETGICQVIIPHYQFEFALTNAGSVNLTIDTEDASDWHVDWGDGNAEFVASGVSGSHTHSSFTGVVTVTTTAPIVEWFSNGTGAWSFTLADLPRTLTLFQCHAGNTISGPIADLPRHLTNLICKGNNTISGDIGDCPVNLTYFELWGNTTVGGNVANLPAVLTFFVVRGTNTVTGDIANMPANLVHFQVLAENTLSGDLTNIPASLTFFRVGYFADLTMAPGGAVAPTSMSTVIVRAFALSSTEIDDLLIALADNVTTWTGAKIIDLREDNEPRTSASDAAVSTLTGLGVNVLTN